MNHVSLVPVTYIIGKDIHGREHTIDVSLETGADGTVGIRLYASRGQLIVQPINRGEIYVTSLRPNNIQPKDQSQ